MAEAGKAKAALAPLQAELERLKSVVRAPVGKGFSLWVALCAASFPVVDVSEGGFD